MSAAPVDPLRESLLERRTLYEGRMLHVFDDRVRLEDGRVTRREMVEHPGAVCIIAIDAAGRVAMVRQWRHPIGRAIWELPAGTRDHPGEDPAATAARELQEEMQAAATTWSLLGAWPLAPGYSSEVMQFFLATGISSSPGAPDPDEQLERAWLTPDEAGRQIRGGIVDVKTVAGLAMAGFPVEIEARLRPVAIDG